MKRVYKVEQNKSKVSIQYAMNKEKIAIRVHNNIITHGEH